MLKIYPYLNFDGTCEEALKFYQSVLGGHLTPVNRFGEMPTGATQLPEAEKNRVMHMALNLSDDFSIMGSDISPSLGHKLSQGNNNYIMINPESREEGERIFNELSANGKIEIPYQKQFWGDYFGSFNDKFGILWMINFGEQ